MDYKSLQGSNDPWYFIPVSSSLFPFNCLNNNTFSYLIIQNDDYSQCKTSCIAKNCSVLLKQRFKLFNNNNILNNSDNKDLIIYFHDDEIQRLNKDTKQKNAFPYSR